VAGLNRRLPLRQVRAQLLHSRLEPVYLLLQQLDGDGSLLFGLQSVSSLQSVGLQSVGNHLLHHLV